MKQEVFGMRRANGDSCDELYRGLYEADQFYSSVNTQHVSDEYRDSLRARLRAAFGGQS